MFYVYDDQNNKVEALSKEGVLALLEQAIEDGDLEFIDEDSAFVSKLKETNGNTTVRFWFGTMADYNAIQTKDPSTMYILTDDDSADSWDEIAELVETHSQDIDEINNIINTAIKIKTFTCTTLADLNTKLQSLDISQVINLKFINNQNILGNRYIASIYESSCTRTTASGSTIIAMEAGTYVFVPSKSESYNYGFVFNGASSKDDTLRFSFTAVNGISIVNTKIYDSGHMSVITTTASVNDPQLDAEFKLTYMEV